MDGVTKKRPVMTINGIGWWSGYGRGKGLDIVSRIADIVGDRSHDTHGSIDDLSEEVRLEGDKTEYHLTSYLTLRKRGDALQLGLELHDTNTKDEPERADFILVREESELIIPDACIVRTTQRQFQQFVHLALVIQDFARDKMKK